MTDLPVTGPPGGFFLCDVLDAIPKGDMATMEHPVFSLSTRPDLRILRYEHAGARVTVTPSVKGLATIHDKDILIYCVSQLMAALNAGRAVARTLHLRAADLLAATGRESSGDGYRRLREAFERLAGTRITTDIVTGDVETTTGFGLIESWEIVRKTRGGRMVSVAVTLSDWLYRAVCAKSVLTLSRDYFGLRKPLERRLYEIARKHCGRQPAWRCSVEVLHLKSGSASPRRVFRKMLRDMAAADALPDYHLEMEEGDVLRVRPRAHLVAPPATPPTISEAARDEARALRPGMDVHALEAEWRGVWDRTGRKKLRAPDRAFLGWLKKGGA
ncbi:replication initiator protein A [Jannaschia seohaensis]|uniref:Plasmid replication initiation protein n=1 Tax=Jannaschia seohaensis TaxID=475081 RepID=A0A2Y9C8Y7_9RHOB|nr:replication initiator protein A [Jannaschia seohaensis]PWJ12925.1 plasmid replication initiation protein [Jannaschia seohaensis]SSA50733.1 Plasmid replication initiator protein [Jannaschia seohaensis]